MERLVGRLTDYIDVRQDFNDSEREVIRVGLILGIEFFGFFIISICISIYLNRLVECMVLLTVLFFIRSYAGGFHFKKFRCCLPISCVIVSGILILSPAVIPNTHVSIVVIFMILLKLCLTGSVECSVRKLEEYERRCFSRKLWKMSGCLFASAILLAWRGYALYLSVIVWTLGFILVSVMVQNFLNRVRSTKE